MKAIELTVRVNKNHHLSARLPESVPPGQVRVLVLLPEEDDAGAIWMEAIAREWATEMTDPREDIYTLEDGEPVNEAR